MIRKQSGYIIFHLGIIAAMLSIFYLNSLTYLLGDIIPNISISHSITYYIYDFLMIGLIILAYKLIGLKINKLIKILLVTLFISIPIFLFYTVKMLPAGFCLINILEIILINLSSIFSIIMWLMLSVSAYKINQVTLADTLEDELKYLFLKDIFSTIILSITTLFIIVFCFLNVLYLAFEFKEESAIGTNSKDYICKIDKPFLSSSDETRFYYYEKINPVLLKETYELSRNPNTYLTKNLNTTLKRGQ